MTAVGTVNVVLIVVAALAALYLVVALVFPERF
ncbi:potassium-transporting ATPase subunit F [Williamsia sterculiae]|uniref:F subunit of K+-transporting ATPase (Potass_KdpF) n=1 Tax=Williamsia sterculiae TaxID=1344003 RepID=A0A1N7GJ06_9NOCA|nr:potassium-transporting ATPase subunit F [Williamsia sterculiae]SIS12583.1 F subunit of K+-transporting ATPase (Potass_KdpF) [Williamsia sterculiae]